MEKINYFFDALHHADLIYEAHRIHWDQQVSQMIDVGENGEPVFSQIDGEIYSCSSNEERLSLNGFTDWYDFKKYIQELFIGAVTEMMSPAFINPANKAKLSGRLEELESEFKTNHPEFLKFSNNSTLYGAKGVKLQASNAYLFTSLAKLFIDRFRVIFNAVYTIHIASHENIVALSIGKRLKWNLSSLSITSIKFKDFYANLKSHDYIDAELSILQDAFTTHEHPKKIKWLGTAGELNYLLASLGSKGYFIDHKTSTFWDSAINTFCQRDGFDFKNAGTLQYNTSVGSIAKKNISLLINILER